MRIIGHILLTLFIAVLIAPAVVVCDFVIEREHIARDLCVQRMVPEGQRTCHGECCLMKRLHKAEQREQSMPQELRLLKLDDMSSDRLAPLMLNTQGLLELAYDARERATLPGHAWPSDPVPWC